MAEKQTYRIMHVLINLVMAAVSRALYICMVLCLISYVAWTSPYLLKKSPGLSGMMEDKIAQVSYMGNFIANTIIVLPVASVDI